MKIFLDVIGCRLNQSEVEGFANIFRALGHQIVSEPGQADVAIVNTCAVTVKAGADSRKQIRRASREGASTVIATGCWATLEPETAQNLPGVTEVFPNDQKDQLVMTVLNKTAEELSALQLIREPLPGDRGRTRAFIKVQEGCDNRCTYCLTRLARGKSRSRELLDIHRDVQAALDGDVKEIVLTGVQLGAWGRDFNEPQGLRDLLANILENQQIKRVRLSSIEPWEFDLSLLSLWQDERLCRHFHIPLQSGSESILKKMGRPISVADYLGLIDKIRAMIPDVAITTDVIAGFPGERDADFAATKAIIEAVAFAGGHVFTFSPRPGTAANLMEDRVPPQVAKARNAILRNVFKQTGHAYREGFIGKSMFVLWESGDHNTDGLWQLSGLTDNYIRVYAMANANLWNAVTSVTLNAHHPIRSALLGFID